MEESSNVKKVGSGGKNLPDFVKNMGGADKNIRLGAGGALALVGLFGSKLWLIIGAYLIITMYLGICPIYSFLKHDTLK